MILFKENLNILVIYMRIILPRTSLHNSNVMRKGGAVMRMCERTSTAGKGMTKEFYEKTDVKHPYQTFNERANSKNMLESVKIKSSKPKKYISFNV